MSPPWWWCPPGLGCAPSTAPSLFSFFLVLFFVGIVIVLYLSLNNPSIWHVWTPLKPPLWWVGGWWWKPKILYSSGPNLTLLTLTWPSPDLHPTWTWAWQQFHVRGDLCLVVTSGQGCKENRFRLLVRKESKEASVKNCDPGIFIWIWINAYYFCTITQHFKAIRMYQNHLRNYI